MYRASLVATPQRYTGNPELESSILRYSDVLHSSISALERSQVARSPGQRKKKVPAGVKAPRDAAAAQAVLAELGDAVAELEGAAGWEGEGEDTGPAYPVPGSLHGSLRSSLPDLRPASGPAAAPALLRASASAPHIEAATPAGRLNRSADGLPPVGPQGAGRGGGGREEGERVEAWLEGALASALGTSLAREGLSREALRAIGVPAAGADRLYRTLYLYGAGVHGVLTSVLEPGAGAGAASGPEGARLEALLRAWGLVVQLAEHTLKARLGADFTKVVQAATGALRRMRAAYDGGVLLVKGAQNRLAARVRSLEAALERQQREAGYDSMAKQAVIERLATASDAQTRELLAVREMENRYLATVREQAAEEAARREAAEARAAEAEARAAEAEAAAGQLRRRLETLEREKYAEARRAEAAAGQVRARRAAETADKRVEDAVAVVRGELRAARADAQRRADEAAALRERLAELEALEGELARAGGGSRRRGGPGTTSAPPAARWSSSWRRRRRSGRRRWRRRGRGAAGGGADGAGEGARRRRQQRLAEAEERERALQRERAELQRELEAVAAERDLAAAAAEQESAALYAAREQLEGERGALAEARAAQREAAERAAGLEEALRVAEASLSQERIAGAKRAAAAQEQAEQLQAALAAAREQWEAERRARSALEESAAAVAQSVGGVRSERDELLARVAEANARADMAARSTELQRKQLLEQLQGAALERTSVEARALDLEQRLREEAAHRLHLEQRLRDEATQRQVAERVATESVRIMEQARSELEELKGGGANPSGRSARSGRSGGPATASPQPGPGEEETSWRAPSRGGGS
eukprot:tig00001056_g6630.t1